MASLKVPKSVAQNLGHHYLSATNWQGEDYVVNHLRRRAWETEQHRIEIDILNVSVRTPGFGDSVIQESIASLKQMLTYLLGRQNLPADSGQVARLVVALKLPEGIEPVFVEGPGADECKCEVILVDQHGKQHRTNLLAR